MSTSLTLFVPGLCTHWRSEDTDLAAGVVAAQTPLLRRILARADREHGEVQAFEDALAGAFGLSAQALPWGALGSWGESGACPQGFVLRLDPVHLKLGMTDAIVLGGAALHVSMDEAETLARALEQHFSDQSWRIVVAAPQRWYLHLPESSDLVNAPLAQALGRDAGLFKPQGADARRWLADVNEVQMLLFAHPLNQTREARGQPTINSVWPWGAGALPLPPSRGERRVDKRSASTKSVPKGGCASLIHPTDFLELVYTHHPLARGLAYAQGLPLHDLPETWQECTDLHTKTPEHALIVLDDLLQPMQDGDFDDWQATLEGLEARWFAPLWTALVHGRINKLTLETGGATRFVLKPAHRWRLWRREISLEQQCAANV